MGKPVNARARLLLRTLVAEYIRSGLPVGSRALAQHSGLELSPATVRNVMADLEDSGYIRAPHTSAGRVPTAQGYRFFVDTLLTVSPLDNGAAREIERKLAVPQPSSQVIGSASDLLSMLTSFVGVVTVPRREQFAFRHIDFVAISEQQILVILVFQDGEVQNRIIHVQKKYKPEELERAARYLNHEYAGLLLGDIRQRLVADMSDARRRMDELMKAAVEIAKSVLDSRRAPQVVLSGETNLMACQDLSDVDTLKSLFDTFQHKRDILQLLEACAHADGVRLYIGEESGNHALEGCSVISAPYAVNGRVVGALGVIGPTRMAYERVISVVEATARILGSALDQQDT